MLIMFATTLFAQRKVVASALRNKEKGNLESAYNKILKAVDTENKHAKGTIKRPETWILKGQILQEIYHKKNEIMVDKPLFEAHNAFLKALELDVKGKHFVQLKMNLTSLQADMLDYADSSMEIKNYDTALNAFNAYLEISDLQLMRLFNEKKNDSLIFYNAGLAAYMANNQVKALDYFTKSAKLNYNGAECYSFIYEIYQISGDTLKSIELLNEGFEKYYDNEMLIKKLIKYYADINENDPYLFVPYYNLATQHFNNGFKFYNEANSLTQNDSVEYEQIIAKGNVQLGVALQYYEKAYRIKPDDVTIMEALRNIYYRLQMFDKYEEIKQKIKNFNK